MAKSASSCRFLSAVARSLVFLTSSKTFLKSVGAAVGKAVETLMFVVPIVWLAMVVMVLMYSSRVLCI